MQQQSDKRISDTLVEVCTWVRNEDLNHYGSIHGGRLFTMADEVGFLAAHGHTGSKCVTVAAHQAHFSRPLPLETKLIVSAYVALVGHSSIWVDVQINAIDEGAFLPAMQVVIVYVSVDDNNKPIRATKVLAVSDEEKMMWQRMERLHQWVRQLV